MSTHFEQIAADAMKLTLRDRVRLAQQLVSTLEDEIDQDVEEIWLAEAERRMEELRSGQVKGVGAEEAFLNARTALKE